jgi:glucose/arabinose dehydrogenase/mono/diheme cytochrome c family protein
MRYPFLSLSFAFALALASTASAGLIHRWSFDENSGTTLADRVGGAAAQVVVQPGGGGHSLGGGGIRLDGGDRTSADYIAMPGNVFDGLSDLTLELWATPHSFPRWGRVLDIGPGDGAPVVAGQNLLRWSFSVENDGNRQRAGVWGLPPLDSNLATNINQRYHYAVSWDADGGPGGGGRLAFYRNGVLIGSQDSGATTIATLAALADTRFWLGRSHFGADETANATFEELRVYDTVLDAAALQANFISGPDSGSASPLTGLLHRWNFNGNLNDEVGASTARIIDPDSNPATGGGGSLLTQPGSVRLAGGARDSSAYVSLGANLLAGRTTPISLEVWATTHSPRLWSRIFDFGSGPAENLFMSWTMFDAANTDRVGFADLGQEISADNTNAPYLAGTEYHIVMIVEPDAGGNGQTRVTWYASPAGDTTTTTAKGSFSAPHHLAGFSDPNVWLGRSQYGDETADASYNEFRIYDRALTPQQILVHRLSGPDSFALQAPVASADSAELRRGGAVGIEVLANDSGSGLDPSSLEILDAPAHGSAVVQPDGRILYRHVGGSTSAADAFSYRVSNYTGGSSAPASVSITVTDALRLAAPSLRLPADPPVLALATVDAFPGLSFEDALCIRHIPGETQRLFIGERRGVISYVPDIHAATPERKVLIDLSAQVAFDNTNEGELGLLGFAFHPDFAGNGHFFVFYTAPGAPYFDRVSRFTIARDGNNAPILSNPSASPASEQVLINQVDEVFNHNAGDLHFGPDGYLYIAMGDEGDQMNGRLNAQRIDKDLFSAILRIDVDRLPGGSEPNPHPAIPTDAGVARFKIPAGNPFTAAAGWDGRYNGSAIPDLGKVRTEMYATGLRSPWRMSFDPENGELWIGDVGQDAYEEVHVVSSPGRNLGWAFREGFQPTPGIPTPQIPVPPAGFSPTDPVWGYAHPGGASPPNFTGQSVTGGVVYRGTRLPALSGAYLFADFVSGNIWALRRQAGGPQVERIAGDAGIAAFGIDPSNGDVLLADYAENKIKRLTVADVSGGDFPAKLSDTGIFADLATLGPNPGVEAYQPNVPFWSDHAIKTRWFALPDTIARIGYAQDDNFSFPVGMVWVKHFDLELTRGDSATRKRIETRVLVRNPGGSYGVSYKWNEAGTEAYLVPEAGESFPLTVQVSGVPTRQIYEIPSRANCLQCHTPVAGHALSFNARQLHRDGLLAGRSGNQLDTLRLAGYLGGPAPDLAAFAPFTGAVSSLEFRVRSYLAVNCVSCHQPGGSAPSTWDARPELTLEESGLIGGPAARPGSDPANRLVVPGDPGRSILLSRIQASNGFTRMPPIGSHVLDAESIEAVAAWITGELPGRLLYSDWAATHPGLGARGDDPDGDGADNYDEFVRGTSPLRPDASAGPGLTLAAGRVALDFVQPPHRVAIVESSGDLATWQAWPVEGNTPRHPATATPRLLEGPADGHRRFFRVRLSEP